MFDAMLYGYLVALSLIVVIGAQNAFVLRQGLRREHVGVVVAVFAISDAVLITAGVAGFSALAASAPWIVEAMRWAGAAFLMIYGALRFRAALQGGAALQPVPGEQTPLLHVVATSLLLTWANPHVYLDTVMLLGSISAQYAPYQLAFGAAAVLGSLSFFSVLGYGARLLAPLFAKPVAWVWLEIIVGFTMWGIAATLILG